MNRSEPTLQKRTAGRDVSYYAQPDQGPLDEDAIPRAAALLAALTDPVPVGTVERPLARAGQVFWRAAVLLVLVALTYGSTLFATDLLDGELDAYRHQASPELVWADLYRLPASLVGAPTVGSQTAGSPPVLRLLMHQQVLTYVMRFLRQQSQPDGVLAHRVGGLFLHATVTVLVWLVLRRLNRPGGWLAAALFAVNPGSAAAVEWLDSRGRLWGALLALLGSWLLLRAVGVPVVQNIEAADVDPEEGPRGFRRFLSFTVAPLIALAGMIALLAATLCQPTVAATGLVLVVLVKWRRGLRVWDVAWIVPVVLLVAAATVGVARQPLPEGGDPVVAGLPMYQHALWWTGQAVRRLAWPLASADLSAIGAKPQVLFTCGIGGAFVLGVVVLTALRRWIDRGPAVAGVCVLLLLPTMLAPLAVRPLPGLLASQQMMAAGTYLVCIPVLAALADGVVAAAQRVKVDIQRRLTELVAAGGTILVLGCIGAVRAHAFADTETILKTAVRVNGRLWADRSRLAEWYISQKRPDAALDVMFGLTMETCPDAPTAIAMGDLVQTDRDLKGAMTWYRHAESLAPDDPEPIGKESQTLVAMDRVGDAVDNYEKAIERHPGSAALHFQFGLLLRNLGNLSLAEEEFRKATVLDPENADQHVALATALADQKRPDEAARELQEAVRLDPENFDAFHDAGLILLQLGADDRSVRMLAEGVRLRPDSAIARSDLAVALIKIKKLKLAQFQLQEALRLQPNFSAAKSNLAVCERLIAVEQQRANVEGK